MFEIISETLENLEEIGTVEHCCACCCCSLDIEDEELEIAAQSREEN